MKIKPTPSGEFPNPVTQPNWNGSKLTDLFSREETGEPLSDKTARDYVRKHLVNEMGLEVHTAQGERRIELEELIDRI